MNAIIKIFTVFIFITAIFTSCSTPPPEPKSEAGIMLKKACEFLMSKQSGDGGWHSNIHGLLKGGQAYTPFIVHALLNVPDSIFRFDAEKKKQALNYIRGKINVAGVIGKSDPLVMEYPNYSTAYALRCLAKNGDKRDEPFIRKMQNYLASENFNENRGFTPDTLAYGCWGFGEEGLPPGYVGQADVSHTRRVLQALRESNYQGSEYLYALKFLYGIQKRPEDFRRQPNLQPGDKGRNFYDGGFYYSPTTVLANKGGQEPAHDGFHAYYRSYATATCDGLLSYLAAGTDKDSPEVQDALRWLENNSGWEKAAGIPEDDPDQWVRVMIIYHVAVRAEAYHAMGKTGWQKEMIAFLKTLHAADGSFSNPEGGRNKEDDPMLGTALAVVALTNGL